VVLLVAIVLEGLALRTAVLESNRVRGSRSWARFIRTAKAPELPVILLEDLGALCGLVFALIGVTMTLVPGEGRWDAGGTGMIGLLLIVIAVVLAVEMKSLLIGESATREHQAAIDKALPGDGVKSVIHLRTLHLAPTSCWSPPRSPSAHQPPAATSRRQSTTPNNGCEPQSRSRESSTSNRMCAALRSSSLFPVVAPDSEREPGEHSQAHGGAERDDRHGGQRHPGHHDEQADQVEQQHPGDDHGPARHFGRRTVELGGQLRVVLGEAALDLVQFPLLVVRQFHVRSFRWAAQGFTRVNARDRPRFPSGHEPGLLHSPGMASAAAIPAGL
jgi:hypothetical protein